MSSFSPYTYKITQFEKSSTTEYYDFYTFLTKPNTFLTKPIDRNVYKVSLAQMLNYLVDFGIGYNSVCTATIANNQKFKSVKYVNRHGTNSPNRPATVADLKEFLLNAVKAMIRHTVNPTGNTDNRGVRRNNIVYPKYIFTLDTDSKFAAKLKTITGKDYVEVNDFSDFAYTSTDSYDMPAEYADGYVSSDLLLMCPAHNHPVHENMNKSIGYKWKVQLRPQGNTMWEGHANGRQLLAYGSKGSDRNVNPLCAPSAPAGEDKIPMITCTATGTANWQYPTVDCMPNEKQMPLNAIEDKVTIRFPGRRYRLFKKVE